MDTIVYLMRHSKTKKLEQVCNSDSLLLQNEKEILSIEGENLANSHSKNKEFKDIDVVISSNYTRASATAKYIAERNNVNIKIIEGFNERVHGVNSWDELPENFETLQFNNDDYKIGFGESRKEVRERMEKSLNKVLNDYKGKRIVIVSHNTAIMYLLRNWCEIKFCEYIKYKDKILFNGDDSYCLTFKLTFDKNNNVTNIEVIRS